MRILILLAILISTSMAFHKIPLTSVNKDITLEDIRKSLDYMESRYNSTTNLISVPLIGQFYTGDIEIGTPGQKFNVLFDTGSDTLWVTITRSLDQYDRSKSNTHKAQGKPFEIIYGYGMNPSGVLCKDTVCIAGACVTDQIFGEATHIFGDPRTAIADGILGLWAIDDPDSVISNMFDQGILEDSVFSFWLDAGFYRNGMDGLLMLGGVDKSLYEGEISYTDVIEQRTWTVSINNVGLGDQHNLVCNEDCAALIDSGTSIILCPYSSLKVICNTIGGTLSQDMCIVECDKTMDMPRLVFTFNGVDFSMMPDEYVAPYFNICRLVLLGRNFHHPDYKNFWIIGQPFFKAFYTVFDFGQKKIGFAKSVQQ